ncbi:MAG: sigma 54-interacting transcriptional regulator [Deltaproteobacteria bacterium]|nr:sigma 54-interacting transcriptional regulator [Deltaproteobacteria bacterium]
MEQTLYPVILDAISDAVFTVDEAFRLTSFNRAAEEMTGVPRKQALGMHCYDVFRANICQGRCALRHSMTHDEPLRDVRITLLDAQMEEVPVRISTSPLRSDDGTFLGGVEIMHDLSEVETLRRELNRTHSFQDLVGKSPPMQALFQLLPDVSRADVPVLIQGPSGTGKEMVAQAVHRLSERRDGPFVSVNCGALPDTLLESELFGYRKGAFTDARRDYPGRFVAASGGTLLLDEIGDTSAAFQVKLLRVLQEREVTPLGATHPVPVDVRIVAATNRDLRAMVSEGTFRQDLYYRLRVVELSTPGLAERPEDVPLLVDHLLLRIASRRGLTPLEITPEALEALLHYPFPGNIRELENILERAYVLCRTGTIKLEHLPAEVTRAEKKSAPVQQDEELGERESLQAALELHRWNRTLAAEALGISRSTLWRRMRAFDL